MWTKFLDSLETEGGKMFVLIFMLMFIICVSVALLLTGHPPQEVGREAIASATSSLLGILYGKLGGKPAPKP